MVVSNRRRGIPELAWRDRTVRRGCHSRSKGVTSLPLNAVAGQSAGAWLSAAEQWEQLEQWVDSQDFSVRGRRREHGFS
jgi:hypothetical protein